MKNKLLLYLSLFLMLPSCTNCKVENGEQVDKDELIKALECIQQNDLDCLKSHMVNGSAKTDDYLNQGFTLDQSC